MTDVKAYKLINGAAFSNEWQLVKTFTSFFNRDSQLYKYFTHEHVVGDFGHVNLTKSQILDDSAGILFEDSHVLLDFFNVPFVADEY